MKEPHEEGVASHSAPSFVLSTARCPVKRKQGHGWAGHRASKNCNRDADAVVKAEGNMIDLHSRVHRGAYRAQPSRRVFIPKSDGRQRPLGIAALEDKIVQQAVVTSSIAFTRRTSAG
jgi:hypothetical protein